MKKWILLLLVPAVFASCRFGWGKRVNGNGNFKTEERKVGTFHDVDAGGAYEVYINQGAETKVVVEADENLLAYIETKVEGDKLVITNRRGYNLSSDGHIKVHVTAPEYHDIDVSGACDIIGETKISGDHEIRLSGSGASKIDMDLTLPKIEAEISGGGTIRLKGQTKNVTLTVSGAGDVHCFDLQSENTRVEITGAGSAEVYASVSLEAEVSGAGTVKYKGGATNVKPTISGAGSVQKAD